MNRKQFIKKALFSIPIIGFIDSKIIKEVPTTWFFTGVDECSISRAKNIPPKMIVTSIDIQGNYKYEEIHIIGSEAVTLKTPYDEIESIDSIGPSVVEGTIQVGKLS